MSYAIKLDKDQKVKLGDINPADTGKADKDATRAVLAELGAELSALQEWLYAAQSHSVLIVLQGLDTSGKDGTIAHVMSSINPQGCDVASFKVPTPIEAAHDFLWRAHQRTPGKGMMTIFNRSHYEDVLVTRVHKLITKDTWEARYGQINNFEKLLADNNTIILKFFLHISKKEQEERLLAREQDEEKAWKLSPGDWEERQYWESYTSAYEEALGATGTKNAPWYIIPANHKWFRNLAIATALVETLRPYKPEWKETLKKLGEERKAELQQMRAGGEADAKADAKNPAKTH
jgi:PPK2 family polyphosphate:nucleotide phosphotransferase